MTANTDRSAELRAQLDAELLIRRAVVDGVYERGGTTGIMITFGDINFHDHYDARHAFSMLKNRLDMVLGVNSEVTTDSQGRLILSGDSFNGVYNSDNRGTNELDHMRYRPFGQNFSEDALRDALATVRDSAQAQIEVLRGQLRGELPMDALLQNAEILGSANSMITLVEDDGLSHGNAGLNPVVRTALAENAAGIRPPAAFR